jgi:cytochrome c biogenesis protein CcmG/thiol:disulfide interchange protein DsbE
MDRNKLNSAQVNTWVDDRLATLNAGGNWQPNVNAGFARLQELKSTARWFGKRALIFATATAIVLVIGVMAYPSPKVFAHRCLECSVAVWHTIAPSAWVQANLTPENSRSAAPEFTLKDVNEADVRLSDQKGKVILVNFWATWCHGCQTEIPWYIDFQKKFGNQGFVVIGISLDDDGWKSVKPWLKEKKVNYPIVIGNDGLGKQYGLDGMPLTALVDREGRIADVHSGVVNRAATEQKIQALLKESAKTAGN